MEERGRCRVPCSCCYFIRKESLLQGQDKGRSQQWQMCSEQRFSYTLICSSPSPPSSPPHSASCPSLFSFHSSIMYLPPSPPHSATSAPLFSFLLPLLNHLPPSLLLLLPYLCHSLQVTVCCTETAYNLNVAVLSRKVERSGPVLLQMKETATGSKCERLYIILWYIVRTT